MKTFEFTNEAVIIIDEKNVSEKVKMFDHLDPVLAVKMIRREQAAGRGAAEGAISLLVDMLDNPRFGGYKGQTPIGEKIVPEFRKLLRNIETEYLQPAVRAPFFEGIDPENEAEMLKASVKADNAWIAFEDGKTTGTYAMVKSYVSKLFCHLGQLPRADNGKLFPINVIKTILANSKAGDKGDNGIAGKLAEIRKQFDSEGVEKKMGDIPTALAALKDMVRFYEHAWAKAQEDATMMHQAGIMAQSASVLAKASAKPADIPSVDSIQAQFDNGQISQLTYQIMMLDHHGIDVDVEEEAPF